MKKLLAFVVLAGFAGAALADDLAEGIKAWESRDFVKAHQLLGKLAATGNPEAQLLVGEMYGFGEGVPEDMATAQGWLSKARANGHKDAAESLNVLQERSARKQEIAYYVSGYKGDELMLEKYSCVKPGLPAEPRVMTQKEIKDIRTQFETWSACYERFGQGLAAANPAGKAIPLEVARVMSLSELQQARTAMDKVNADIAVEGDRQARAVVASYNAWATSTASYNLAMKKKIDDETERAVRDADHLMERYRNATGSATTPGAR